VDRVLGRLIAALLLDGAFALRHCVNVMTQEHILGRPWQAARRHAAVCVALAWCAFVVAPALLLPRIRLAGPAQGVVIGLVPALAGAAFLLVLAIGEVTWPRPTGDVRRAPLTRRGPADVAPRAARRSAWAAYGVLTVLLLSTGLTAAGDGRSVAYRYAIDMSGASGPYPGWYFGVPLLVGCLVVLGGEVLLRLIARRPVVSGASTESDLALRRASASRALAGVHTALLGTLAGVLLVTGSALHSLGARGSLVEAPWLATLGTVTGVVAAVVGLVALGAGVLLTLRSDAAPTTAPVTA
jgi:hypothetical protein